MTYDDREAAREAVKAHMRRLRATDDETEQDFLRRNVPLLPAVHPMTCNGGNPDWTTHHDHEVRLVVEGGELVCPECGRRQELT